MTDWEPIFLIVGISATVPIGILIPKKWLLFSGVDLLK